MHALLLVGIGGFIGSVARYTLGGWILQLSAQQRFPWGTLAVNLLGCLLIGLLAALAERHSLLASEARLFLLTGLLGGFTTFSTFGLETVELLRRGDPGLAAVYATSSTVLGLGAVWIGLKLVMLASR